MQLRISLTRENLIEHNYKRVTEEILCLEWEEMQCYKKKTSKSIRHGFAMKCWKGPPSWSKLEISSSLTAPKHNLRPFLWKSSAFFQIFSPKMTSKITLRTVQVACCHELSSCKNLYLNILALSAVPRYFSLYSSKSFPQNTSGTHNQNLNFEVTLSSREL